MNTDKYRVVITNVPPDLMTAQQFVADPSFGAVTSFVGVVRNHNEGRRAEAVTYDVHETLALKTLGDLCEKALVQADKKARIYIAHIRGVCKVGEASVVIAVGTPHRKMSFDLCEELIDRLKECTPIWKQEHYVEGNSEWLSGTALRQAT